MKAVILAAGKGTRMLPLTAYIPKVMVEINGKPFVEYVLENVKAAGATEIAMIVGYKQEAIREYFGDAVTYIEQTEQHGTAHAISLAQSFTGDDVFIVVNGDNLYSVTDLKHMMQSEMLLGVVHTDTPERYGMIEEKEGKCASIVEKPKREDAPSNIANAGLYTFTKEIYPVIQDLPMHETDEYVIIDAFNVTHPRLIFLEHGFLDLGCPEDIPRVEKELIFFR